MWSEVFKRLSREFFCPNSSLDFSSITCSQSNSPLTIEDTDNMTIDLELKKWLIANKVDVASMKKILSHEFTFTDFINYTEKSDIERIGLK